MDDIIGLSEAKRALHETIVLPSLRPDVSNCLSRFVCLGSLSFDALDELDRALTFCNTLVVYWTPKTCQGYSSLRPAW